ncbi:hypothetical protein JK211_16815 [Tatumella sp. JGM130]|uniref:hypothetical protein n=1 Tax=Tatumella sp. JGM130 TaxID=2799797 RepID=UPI001BAE8709|nr:hypothetical protein [Tatumella sp. JGM130]MBS0895647.1 hypothetical protein [Tatumella sp. JGM130]
MSLNLKIECSDVQMRGAMRPEKVSVSLEDCQIETLNREQLAEFCAYQDFDLLVEWVDSMRRLDHVA